MDDTSPPSGNRNGSNSHPDQSQDVLDELRQLLLEPEHEQLDHLQKRLNEWRPDPDGLSRMLPDAFVRRSKSDPKLSTALFPHIEQGVKASIKKDPEALAEAISPIMFPAIRKAIKQALQDMMQSMNQTLEYSLSLRGFGLRWMAMRTGRPFAEVVMLHSLVYRVEQLFLIHRETGLLLRHVAADRGQTHDSEAVSGMMTAIQDFVHDAFEVGDHETLDTFRVGDLTVWVEQGADAYLAALVRGNPPQDVRAVLQDTLATIHRDYDDALDAFAGDNTPFEMTESALEACLVSQRAEHNRQISPLFLWFGLGLILGLAGLGVWSWLQAQWRWDRYVAQLQNLPGIVVTRADKGWGRYEINGLRDPLALDPQQLLEGANIPVHRVVSLWEPYQALYPGFILQRVKRVLQPPDTVTLVLQQGTLVASGRAPQAWIDRARDLTRGFPGVQGWRENDLMVIE